MGTVSRVFCFKEGPSILDNKLKYDAFHTKPSWRFVEFMKRIKN
jgi:hypothetical protein